MNRLLRLIFNLAAVASFICFLAVMVLWVRSYFYNENLHWFGDGRELSLRSSHGEFDGYRVWASHLHSPTQFSFFRNPAKSNLDLRITVLKRDTGMKYFGPHLGFAFFHDPHPGYADRFVEAMIPWWFFALLTAAWPAIHFWRWRKRRFASKPGCCANCGYDLRATPDRCPECGKAPESTEQKRKLI
jgi:hypothetical protein